MFGLALLLVVGLAIVAYVMSRSRSIALSGGDLSILHSRPGYHGMYSALITALAGLLAALVITFGWSWYINHSMYGALPEELKQREALVQERVVIDSVSLGRGGVVGEATEDVIIEARKNLSGLYKTLSNLRDWSILTLVGLAALAGLFLTYSSISPDLRTRNKSETIIRGVLMLSAGVAIVTTFGILLSLIGETVNFFRDVSIFKFLFGTHWSPLSGVYEGKVDENTVGAIPLFAGTAMITIIAMLVAVPIGLFSAIYLSEFASPTIRAISKPMLEILAGIPTVVYGFFAALVVAPFIRYLGESVGLSVSAQSALAAGLVMGIMIIPFISSLSDDVINAVPQALRDGSYGLGATKAETVVKVVLPAALPGIVSAIILAVSRAVGETMIVVMAAGQGAKLTANPLEAVTTVTVQIVALINGDTDAGTAAGPAFSLGFTLFFITMLMNLMALRIVNKYRQKYD